MWAATHVTLAISINRVNCNETKHDKKQILRAATMIGGWQATLQIQPCSSNFRGQFAVHWCDPRSLSSEESQGVINRRCAAKWAGVRYSVFFSNSCCASPGAEIVHWQVLLLFNKERHVALVALCLSVKSSDFKGPNPQNWLVKSCCLTSFTLQNP